MATIKVNAPVHRPATISLTNSGVVAIGTDSTYSIDPRDIKQAFQLGCWLQPGSPTIAVDADGPQGPLPNGQIAGVVGGSRLLGVALQADLNVTTDNAITIIGAAKYIPKAVYVTNCATAPSEAFGGLYTAASKGGTCLVDQAALSSLSAAATFLSHTLQNNTSVLTAGTLYYSCGTAQGAACKGDVYVYGDILA